VIARIAYFEALTAEQETAVEYNFHNRFRAALTGQPGLVASFWLRAADGRRIAISVWERRTMMEDGARRANAVPLLPGQRGEDIPSPIRVEMADVSDHFLGTRGG
jgi:hypothetical protein